MKIAILILYTESWQSMADIVVPNAQEYSDRHGYKLIVQKWPEPMMSNFGYNKLEQIQAIFEHEESDVVMSMDLDAMITNHGIRVEDFIENDFDVYLTSDYNGLNCGVFIIKKSGYSNWLIDRVLEFRGKPKMYCEQDGIREFIKTFPPPATSRIKMIEQTKLNAYLYEMYPEIPLQSHEQGNWNPGDFIIHLPGLGYETRLAFLKSTPIEK